MEADGTLVTDGIGCEDSKPSAKAVDEQQDMQTHDDTMNANEVAGVKANDGVSEATQREITNDSNQVENATQAGLTQSNHSINDVSLEQKDNENDKDIGMNDTEDPTPMKHDARSSPEIIITTCDDTDESEISVDESRIPDVDYKQSEITDQKSLCEEIESESNINIKYSENETKPEQTLIKDDIQNSQVIVSMTQTDEVDTMPKTASQDQDKTDLNNVADIQQLENENQVTTSAIIEDVLGSYQDGAHNDISKEEYSETEVKSTDVESSREYTKVIKIIYNNSENVPTEEKTQEVESSHNFVDDKNMESFSEKPADVADKLEDDYTDKDIKKGLEQSSGDEKQEDGDKNQIETHANIDDEQGDVIEVAEDAKEDLKESSMTKEVHQENNVKSQIEPADVQESPIKDDKDGAVQEHLKQEVDEMKEVLKQQEEIDIGQSANIDDAQMTAEEFKSEIKKLEDSVTTEEDATKYDSEIEKLPNEVDVNMDAIVQIDSVEETDGLSEDIEQKEELATIANDNNNEIHIENASDYNTNEGSSVDQKSTDENLVAAESRVDQIIEVQSNENEILDQEVKTEIYDEEICDAESVKAEEEEQQQQMVDNLNNEILVMDDDGTAEDVLEDEEWKEDVIIVQDVSSGNAHAVNIQIISDEGEEETVLSQEDLHRDAEIDNIPTNENDAVITDHHHVQSSIEEIKELKDEDASQDENIQLNLEGNAMESKQATDVYDNVSNEGVTAEDIAEAMKDRPSSSQQSTPSYQNLVGDVEEEVRQHEEEQNIEEGVNEQSESSSSSSSSTSSEEEEGFSGNDIDLEDPDEYLDQSENLLKNEGTPVDAPQIAPLDDVDEKEMISNEETSRLANEIVNEAVNLAIAYIDNNEQNETEEQQIEARGDNDVAAQSIPDVHSFDEKHVYETQTETNSTEKESNNEAFELPAEHKSYQKDETLDTENKQSKDTTQNQILIEQQVTENISDKEEEALAVAIEESTEQQIEEDIKDNKENDMSKTVYNPALSQRNTEAEKWFGQPTSDDKIFMRPKGKLDMNAELERKKLIKSMTKRHNPKIVSKWQPSVEKNWEDNLEGQQKQSLEKYKQRRQNRLSSSTYQGEDNSSEKPVTEKTVENNEAAEQEQASEDIVVEPVVHSRDAISKWEHILQEKTEKEEIERKRLSVGKQLKTPRPYEMHRQRKDSDSSVTSNTSSNAPSSDLIVRESMNIKDIRNRWKNIEEESKQTKPVANYRRQSAGTTRSNSFTVKAAPMYRPNMRSSTVKEEQTSIPKPVNHPRKPKSKIIPGENFIDREIREAAEREEEYKHEFAAKSPEPPKEVQEDSVIATLKKLPSHATQDIITQTIKEDAERESEWKEEHHVSAHIDAIPQTQEDVSTKVDGDVTSLVCAGLPVRTIVPHHKEIDAESISSFGSSAGSNEAPLSPGSRKKSTKINYSASDSHHQEADSGIECNNQITSTSPEPKPAVVEEPVKAVLTRQKTASEFQEELLKSFKEEETIQEPVKTTVEPKQAAQRARLSSLHTMTPKGWGQMTTTIKPISPVSPGHKKVAPPTFSVKKTNGVASPTQVTPVEHNTFTVTPNKNSNNQNNKDVYDDDHWNGALRKTVEVSHMKTGPVFQLMSSKSNTQSRMKKEIEDAKQRENEWLRKQRAEEEENQKKNEVEHIHTNNNNNIIPKKHVSSQQKVVVKKQVFNVASKKVQSEPPRKAEQIKPQRRAVARSLTLNSIVGRRVTHRRTVVFTQAGVD